VHWSSYDATALDILAAASPTLLGWMGKNRVKTDCIFLATFRIGFSSSPAQSKKIRFLNPKHRALFFAVLLNPAKSVDQRTTDQKTG
jgi:hypothetical protein